MDAVVEYNYVAQEPDELTLRKGEIIKDIKMMPGGWWEGTLKDKRGMFPDNFVKMLDARPISPNVTVGLKNEAESNISTLKKEEIALRNGSNGRKWCKVLYSYEPCNGDELPLIPDDSVEFLGEVEEGWWSGRLRGRIGVFPSNFVSPPVPEESERHHNKERSTTTEYCRVLFPYTAANEDELTLAEDEIVTILSRDAPDKGWWKGSLRGKIGLFPDNFVKIIDVKKESSDYEPEMGQDTNQAVSKISGARPSSSLHTGKRGEKAHARKSLEPNASSFPSSEKKNIANHSIVSTSLKRMTEKSGIKMGDNVDPLGKADEELDGVEREEDTPLLHLTASRAKAPRRRLPSSHHVRNQAGNVTTCVTEKQSATLLEGIAMNGTIDTVDQSLDEEVEHLQERSTRLDCKARKKVPWIEELKLNQMEKKKNNPSDEYDNKSEMIKKERIHGRSPLQSTSCSELSIESGQDNADSKVKEKGKDKDLHYRVDSLYTSTSPVSPTVGSCQTPAYVPYRLYYQLLERVSQLEERQTELQRIVAHLSEQLRPSLINSSAISNNT